MISTIAPKFGPLGHVVLQLKPKTGNANDQKMCFATMLLLSSNASRNEFCQRVWRSASISRGSSFSSSRTTGQKPTNRRLCADGPGGLPRPPERSGRFGSFDGGSDNRVWRFQCGANRDHTSTSLTREKHESSPPYLSPSHARSPGQTLRPCAFMCVRAAPSNDT